MLAQVVRTVILSRDDLVQLHAMLKKLRDGKPLTAVESGVAVETSITGLQLIEPMPPMLFDGTYYTQVLYVATG